MCPWSDNCTGIDVLDDMYMHQDVEGVPGTPDIEYWVIKESGESIDPGDAYKNSSLDELPEKGIKHWRIDQWELCVKTILPALIAPYLFFIPFFMFFIYYPVICLIAAYYEKNGKPKYEVRKHEAED